MQLEPDDVEQLLRLHQSLMFYVGRRLKLVGAKVADPRAYLGLAPEDRVKVHLALPEHLGLIDAFADENPYQFDDADLEIVRSWKHLVAGEFYAFRRLRNDTIFLSTAEPAVAYGVLALADTFEDLLGPHLPRLVKTTLLPFKGRIVYDGLMSRYSGAFGGEFLRGLEEGYRQAKARRGVVRSLPPAAATPAPAGANAPDGDQEAAGGGPPVPAAARPAFDRVVALTDAFCRDHLDDEYAALCRKLAGALARKRPSPLTRGKPESWASGVVRVVGYVNFLGDPSQPHHMKMTDIDQVMGVSEATGSAKSLAIRDMLKIDRFEPEWTVPGQMEKNPLAWMIQINGLIADARRLPREVQEVAYRKGLIPFIPPGRPDEPFED